MKRKVELLAPAGNFDCLKAAISNGADAVYLGGKNFSARAFAGNFDEEELKRAVRYAHLRDVRVFVTLNTLLSEKEFANAIKMADFYYENDVDALLVQDLGLYYYLKNKYPDFELHCSTQMHVHNLQGVRNAKKLGFKRVVVARESTLSFIREACKEDIEIETFVHGAICVSYSGECLMSSSTKNRSANKGMCAQCCRLRYELYEDGNKVKTDTDYLLSPKDMFLLEDIPALMDAGVSSFKIEGRMKSPAYVGYVTSLYRKAIDAHMEGEDYHPSGKEMNDLKVLFNRNFSNDLLYGRKDLFGQKTPNNLGIETGDTLYQKNGLLYMKLSRDLNQFDGIRINEFGCIVNKLYVNGKLVNHADKGQICAIECDENLKGRVYKTQDHLLEEEIARIPEKKVSLSAKVYIHPDKNVKVNLSHDDISFEYVSDCMAQVAQNAPLSEDSIRKQFGKLNDTVYELKEFEADTNNAFLTVKDLNAIRRAAIEAFDAYRLSCFVRKVLPIEYETSDINKDEKPVSLRQEGNILKTGDDIYHLYPVINKESSYPYDDHVVVSEFGGLLNNNEHKIIYYSLNCANSYTYEFFKKLGYEHIILSSELNDEPIQDLKVAYEERNKTKISPVVFIKGDRVLMYIGSDPFGKYMKEDKTYLLKENRNIYDIRKEGDITLLIEKNKVFHEKIEGLSSLEVHL